MTKSEDKSSQRIIEIQETNFVCEEPKEETPVVQEKKGSFIGLVWCFLHIFCLASSSTLVKFISVPAGLKLLIRCCVQFTLLCPAVQYGAVKQNLDVLGGSPATLKALLVSGSIGPLSALCLYQALDRISLGDAVSLTFTNAVFAGILSRIFLKEAYTLLDFFFALLSFVGVLLIAKPTFLFGESEKNYGWYELGGIGLALMNALLMACCLIIIRGLGKTNPILNVFYYGVVGIFIAAVFVFGMDGYYIPCINDLIGLFGIGFLGMSSQLAVTKALQTERASTVAIFRSLQLVLVFIYQIILFNDIPNAYTIGGSVLLLASVVGLTLMKCYHEKKPTSKKE